MAQQFFEHHIPYLTTRIELESYNEFYIGTGFFYLASVVLDNGENRAKMLLISNRHVFLDSEGKFDPNSKVTITLNRKKDDDTPDFGNVIEYIVNFNQIGYENLYFPHPNPDVDLACIDVSRFTHTDAYFRHIGDNLLKPIDYEKIAVGSEVIFVGYPDGRYDTVNNLPLIRKGWIASMPDVDFNGKGQVVIDAQIFEGSSGSPVFVHWGKKYSLFGVVSEAMIRDSELQTLSTNIPKSGLEEEFRTEDVLGIEEVLGLGIVIKQQHVRELIDHTVEEFIRRTSSNS